MTTVERVIAADPTSVALLLAGTTGVLPRRRRTSFRSRFVLRGGPAALTLTHLGGSTVATLTVVSGRAAALAFLDDLASAAEARADAA